MSPACEAGSLPLSHLGSPAPHISPLFFTQACPTTQQSWGTQFLLITTEQEPLQQYWERWPVSSRSFCVYTQASNAIMRLGRWKLRSSWRRSPWSNQQEAGPPGCDLWSWCPLCTMGSCRTESGHCWCGGSFPSPPLSHAVKPCISTGLTERGREATSPYLTLKEPRKQSYLTELEQSSKSQLPRVGFNSTDPLRSYVTLEGPSVPLSWNFPGLDPESPRQIELVGHPSTPNQSWKISLTSDIHIWNPFQLFLGNIDVQRDSLKNVHQAIGTRGVRDKPDYARALSLSYLPSISVLF